MKRTFKKVLSVALCLVVSLTSAVSAVGCGPREEVYDETKVNLQVVAYDGGYGMDWIEEPAKRFIEKYRDTKFGDKVGVDIHVSVERIMGTQFIHNYGTLDKDMYFIPGGNYEDFVEAGVLMDLTDVMTEVPEYNTKPGGTNKSIADNLYDDIEQYLNIDNHYYGIPSHGSGFGFNYDVDMFFNEGLYFKDGYTLAGPYSLSAFINPIHWEDPAVTANNGKYIASRVRDEGTYLVNGQKLSIGPDGVYGTQDDGEPAYYTDFLNLCRYMKMVKGINPVTFMHGAELYVYSTADSLAIDHMGPVNAVANRDFEGTIDIVTGWNGNTPIVEPYTIDTTNAASRINVFKNDGYYWASYLIHQLFANQYYISKVTQEYTHLDAQYDLILSSSRNIGNNDRVGFLMDGAYWEHESLQNNLFKDAVDYTGDEYFAYENRSFKLLASPKVDGTELRKETLMGAGGTYGVILDKVEDKGPEVVEVAKLFYQYLFSDEGNQIYTEKTSLCRSMYFPTDMETMTPYGQALAELYNGGANVINSMTDKDWVRLNEKVTGSKWSIVYEDVDYDRIMIDVFLNKKNITARDYFEGIYNRQIKKVV